MRARNDFYADNIKVLVAIKADPIMAAAIAIGDYAPAIVWLNVVDAGFWIWENALQPEIVKLVFVANSTAVNALSVTDRTVLFHLCSSPLDCRALATRTEIISRLGGSVPLTNAMTSAMRRNATRFEKLVSVGVGIQANPATVDYAPEIDASVVVFDKL